MVHPCLFYLNTVSRQSSAPSCWLDFVLCSFWRFPSVLFGEQADKSEPGLNLLLMHEDILFTYQCNDSVKNNLELCHSLGKLVGKSRSLRTPYPRINLHSPQASMIIIWTLSVLEGNNCHLFSICFCNSYPVRVSLSVLAAHRPSASLCKYICGENGDLTAI